MQENFMLSGGKKPHLLPHSQSLAFLSHADHSLSLSLTPGCFPKPESYVSMDIFLYKCHHISTKKKLYLSGRWALRLLTEA